MWIIQMSALTSNLFSFRLNPKINSKVEDIEITSIKDVKKGQLVRGYVKSVTPSGVFFGWVAWENYCGKWCVLENLPWVYDCGILFGDGLWNNVRSQNEFTLGNQDVVDTILSLWN